MSSAVMIRTLSRCAPGRSEAGAEWTQREYPTEATRNLAIASRLAARSTHRQAKRRRRVKRDHCASVRRDVSYVLRWRSQRERAQAIPARGTGDCLRDRSTRGRAESAESVSVRAGWSDGRPCLFLDNSPTRDRIPRSRRSRKVKLAPNARSCLRSTIKRYRKPVARAHAKNRLLEQVLTNPDALFTLHGRLLNSWHAKRL